MRSFAATCFIVPVVGLSAILVVTGAYHVSTVSAAETENVFQDYVDRPDPAFRWDIVHRIEHDRSTVFVINLVSQQWRSTSEVDRVDWQHWLTVVRPKAVRYDTALLIVGGGSNGKPAPADASPRAKELSRRSQAVVAELTSVPNEPLTFAGHDRPLNEDALLAFCMNRCLETGDVNWLPRLPMVKSVVRAMDAVQSLSAEEANNDGGAKIAHFVVAGASKRGWTTWLVPTVDARVTAIMPMVIDVLNVRRSMAHHLAAYGKWSPALRDYERQQLLSKAAMDRSHELMAIDDPYSYREQLALPKYIVNASGDQYFAPDSSQFYFDDLVGEKHLRYIPNTSHSLDKTDAQEGALAFFQFLLAERPRPAYEWKFDGDGDIALTAAEPPIAVRHWQATSPGARDFRFPVLGGKFTSQPLEPNAAGEYRATATAPAGSWTAHFIEAEFAGPADANLKVTSGVQITPETLPYAEKAKALLE